MAKAIEKNRKKEIIDACEKMYETMGFKDITIKEIATFTSFTRPSIYYYFQTKEEIFLALLQREYEKWGAELDVVQPEYQKDLRLEFAEKVSFALSRRERLLKLLSTNLYDMEMNSRDENLIDFKKAYWALVMALKRCLERFLPSMTSEEVDKFLSSYLPFVYGIYPYAVVDERQQETMKEAGVVFHYQSIYELALLGTTKLLGVEQ